MKVLVTGCAGFIGFHLIKCLLHQQISVIGLDNLNNYYDPSLKEARLLQLKHFPQFTFLKLDITDRTKIGALFQSHSVDAVIHLAAQAGVRYSVTHPFTYIDSNLVGFSHILEGCRQQAVKHCIFASSSSVYGNNDRYPFSEKDATECPTALYGATKKANELMAYSYSHLFHLPCTGLRFFTVYGPWGRPDMALFKFTKNILAEQPIDIYNAGHMWRDFTYIDDAVAGILLVLKHPPSAISHVSQSPDLESNNPFYRIYNIGSQQPIQLLDFVALLEQSLGKKAIKNNLPIQLGDVKKTYADISKITHDFGYQPKMNIKTGIQKFLAWYMDYAYPSQCKNTP